MRVGLLCPFLIGLIVFSGSSCSTAHEIHPSKSEVESLKPALQKLNLGKSTKYVVAFRNLNEGDSLDAIVYLVGPSVCGSGGCNTVVLSYNHGWSIISVIHLTRLPIRVMEKEFYGWHSISVNVSGGGILHPYTAELDFNGKSYPGNPTVPPAVRVDTSKGDIVISSLREAKDLYPQ